jgi:hypothetical protein
VVSDFFRTNWGRVGEKTVTENHIFRVRWNWQKMEKSQIWPKMKEKQRKGRKKKKKESKGFRVSPRKLLGVNSILKVNLISLKREKWRDPT